MKRRDREVVRKTNLAFILIVRPRSNYDICTIPMFILNNLRKTSSFDLPYMTEWETDTQIQDRERLGVRGVFGNTLPLVH